MNNNRNKIISLVLSFILIISLCGCNKKDETQNNQNQQEVVNNNTESENKQEFNVASDNNNMDEAVETVKSELNKKEHTVETELIKPEFIETTKHQKSYPDGSRRNYDMVKYSTFIINMTPDVTEAGYEVSVDKNNIVNISSEKFGTVKIAQINDFKNSTESKVFDLSENLSDKINDIFDLEISGEVIDKENLSLYGDGYITLENVEEANDYESETDEFPVIVFIREESSQKPEKTYYGEWLIYFELNNGYKLNDIFDFEVIEKI